MPASPATVIPAARLIHLSAGVGVGAGVFCGAAGRFTGHP